MNHFVLFLLMGLFSPAVFSQPGTATCAAFKTGLFTYRDDSSHAVVVRRTANRQEEKIKQSGIVTRFKIRWVDDCSYEIKQVWSNSRSRRKNNGATTKVLITSVGNDEYEYTCACKESDPAKKTRGTMYRLPRGVSQ